MIKLYFENSKISQKRSSFSLEIVKLAKNHKITLEVVKFAKIIQF